MKKPYLMVLFGLALVGAYFFLARRASAATSDSAAAGVAEIPSGASGATGVLPPAMLFPGGGSQPLAFEGSTPIPGITPTKFSPVPYKPYTPAPAPAAPRPFVAGGGMPRKGDPHRQLA